MVQIIHPDEEIRKANALNTMKLGTRFGELTTEYPQHTRLFADYLKEQEDECREIEKDYIMSAHLLQVK